MMKYLKFPPPTSGTKQGCMQLPHLFNIITECLASAIWNIWNIYAHIKSKRIYKLLELTKECINVSRHKINIQKLITYLYISRK